MSYPNEFQSTIADLKGSGDATKTVAAVATLRRGAYTVQERISRPTIMHPFAIERQRLSVGHSERCAEYVPRESRTACPFGSNRTTLMVTMMFDEYGIR
jgi:hypothetical protein